MKTKYRIGDVVHIIAHESDFDYKLKYADIQDMQTGEWASSGLKISYQYKRVSYIAHLLGEL